MNILFIGNSHTFFNGLPFIVRALLGTSDPGAEVAMYATGGVTLSWHAEQPETQMAIAYHEWDYVVLQEKSHPFDGYAALLAGCRALVAYMPRPRTRPLLFVTWAEKARPENQAVIDDAFRRVAAELGATLAPVSSAWQVARRSCPDIELYDADGEHASPAGSYLAACVFYSVIRGQTPVGLPAHIAVAGDELVRLPDADAERLQAAAWQAVQQAPAPHGQRG